MEEARIISLINISSAILIFISAILPLIANSWAKEKSASKKANIINKIFSFLMALSSLAGLSVWYFFGLTEFVLIFILLSWGISTFLFIRDKSPITRLGIVIYVFNSFIIAMIFSFYISNKLFLSLDRLISVLETLTK